MADADDQLREALVFHGVQVEQMLDPFFIIMPYSAEGNNKTLGGPNCGFNQRVLQETSCQTLEW